MSTEQQQFRKKPVVVEARQFLGGGAGSEGGPTRAGCDPTPLTMATIRSQYVVHHYGTDFDRALAEHDRQVAERALLDYADFIEQAGVEFSYCMTDDDRDEEVRWADAIRARAGQVRRA